MRKKRKKHLKIVIMWLAVSAVAFGWAAWLTQKITMVDGRPAYNVKPPGFQWGQTPPPRQIVSIYARGLTDDLARQILVEYASDHDGMHPSIKVWLPAGLDVRVLLNNLEDSKNCSAGALPSNYSIYSAGAPMRISATKSSKVPHDPVLLAPEKSARPYSLLCNLSPITSSRTFTKRSATFEYADDSDNPVIHAMFPDLDAAAGGFAPLPKEMMSFGSIDGAEQFWFSGGYQNRQANSFESVRELEPGQFVTVTWSDLNREQLRDLFLVIIGTLIGIGVTVLIEALRIIVDTPIPED
jgi:hypothetical protein